jgi:small-conductance mechanosensitive channel
MNHPLIGSFDGLTDSDVDSKIVELQRKYFMSQNPQLKNQISLALEMYQEEARTRREKAYAKLNQNDEDNGLDNLINIG